MDSREREKRAYIRNAMVSFICVIVCLSVDIRSFIRVGRVYFTWHLGVSYILYALLIFMGIRAVKKARSIGKEGGESK